MHAFTKQRITEQTSILEIKDLKDTKDMKDTKESKDSDKLKSAFKDEKKPTLGEVLNILDGVPERHGHIIIIDTNHLKELDSALIRPGRVDRIVSWGKMCSLSVRRFLENHYQKSVSEDIELPHKQYTAAELQSHTSRCSTLELFLS
jgi:ATP-dependent Zn protease